MKIDARLWAAFGAAVVFSSSVLPAAGEEVAVVFPNGFENNEGNDGDSLGDVLSSIGMRYQQVYPASQFADLPASHRMLIGEFGRPDGSWTFPFSVFSPNNTIRYSTTQRNPGQLSNVFSQNIGPDETIVFQGDRLLSTDNAGPPGGPKLFDIGSYFQTPFYYDPSQGNLLVDVTIVGEVQTVGFDAHDSLLNPTEWVFAGWPGATTATASGVRTAIRQLLFAPAPCDFDLSGTCDIADLNLLLQEGPLAPGVSVTPGMNDQFDLTGDGIIDNADVDEWLSDAASLNGLSSPYLRGDANLDGQVDVGDFNDWNANKFTSTLLWDQGNFNGDANTDVGDFNFWNANKFTASDTASVVPEPAAALLMIVQFAALALLARRAAG